MSYILEALRKVERQRRGRTIPDLATVHGPASAGRRIWLPVVSGVLLVNAGLLAFLLWYRAGTPPGRLAPAATPPPAASDAPASAGAPAAVPPGGSPAATPAPAVVASAPSTTAPASPSAAMASSAATPAPSAGTSTPQAAPASSGVVAPAPGAPAATVTNGPVVSGEPRVGGPDMPEPGPSARAAEAGPRVRIAVPGSDTVREVDVTRGSVPATRTAPPAAGSATRETVKAAVPANLPPSFQAAVSQLRLEALVYAQSPGDRKVFINGRRYLQGDTLDDGILVEKIVEEGAVLSYRGHRYVLRHFR